MNQTPLWDTDEELFLMIRDELYTAVVGDIMDKMGYFQQFLPPQIKPLHKEMFVVGRAMTVLEADWFEGDRPSSHNELLNKPFGLMLEALDSLQTDEVYVCTGSSPRYALWGELMSAVALQRGAAGAVMNGYSRDTRGILNLGFPCFSFGAYAQDQAPRGKVIDYRCPITIEGVKVNPGDIVIGDLDGTCVVPRSIEHEVFTRSLEKARGERTVLKAIQNGMGAVEAFATYGIL